MFPRQLRAAAPNARQSEENAETGKRLLNLCAAPARCQNALNAKCRRRHETPRPNAAEVSTLKEMKNAITGPVRAPVQARFGLALAREPVRLVRALRPVLRPEPELGHSDCTRPAMSPWPMQRGL